MRIKTTSSRNFLCACDRVQDCGKAMPLGFIAAEWDMQLAVRFWALRRSRTANHSHSKREGNQWIWWLGWAGVGARGCPGGQAPAQMRHYSTDASSEQNVIPVTFHRVWVIFENWLKHIKTGNKKQHLDFNWVTRRAVTINFVERHKNSLTNYEPT